MNLLDEEIIKKGYSKPSTQIRAGPAPLASFEDLPTEELFSECSYIEDLPCISNCLDDKQYERNICSSRKSFQRADTACSADMNGSLITLTSLSITPTELSSPTKTLTPIAINNENSNKLILVKTLKVPLSTTNSKNDLNESYQNFKIDSNDNYEYSKNDLNENLSKPCRKGSWTNFFRNRSKSTHAKSPSNNFLSPQQSNNQLNIQIKQKKRKSIFSFFRKSTRSSLQDLSEQEKDFNKHYLISNLNKVMSASSPKVLNELSLNLFNETEKNNEKSYEIILLNDNLNQDFNKESYLSKIELVIEKKDEEFDKKIKEDIFLEDKILDEITIEEFEKKKKILDHENIIDLDKKEVLLRRKLKKRSDTIDEIRSLPESLPSFMKKNDKYGNDSDESDDQTMTEETSKTISISKNNENIETKNLLEEELEENFLYKNEFDLNLNENSVVKKDDKLNIKIIPTVRPRSTTPINLDSFETFIKSSLNTNKNQEKIKVRLPEDLFNDIINKKTTPTKINPQIWFEFCEKGLQIPKFNTRCNSSVGTSDENENFIEEAFTPTITASSTNESINKYLENSRFTKEEQYFEDNFNNVCIADHKRNIIFKNN